MSLNKVTETVIAANALSNAKIANSAIQSRHISTGAVTAEHLASAINVTSVSSNVAIVNANLTALQDNVNSYASTTNSALDTITANSITTNSNIASVLSNQIAITSALVDNTNSVQGNLSGLAGGATAFSSAKTFEQSVTIEGDLVVIGNSSVVGSNNISLNDSILLLANNQTGAPAVDSGIMVNRGSSANVAAYWDESEDVYTVGFTNTPANSTIIIGTGTSLTTRLDIVDARIITNDNAAMATQGNVNSLSTAVNTVTDNVNTVSGNVANGMRPLYNTEVSSGSNVFGVGTATPTNSSNITAYADGVMQPTPAEWIFNSGNNSIQFTDATVASGITIDIQAWYI